MEARIRVRVQNDNVAGVQLPVFEKMTDQSAAAPEAYGLARGGKEIEKCTRKWTTLFENLIQLASLQVCVGVCVCMYLYNGGVVVVVVVVCVAGEGQVRFNIERGREVWTPGCFSSFLLFVLFVDESLWKDLN